MRTLALAVAVGLALALAACGGGDDGAGSGQTIEVAEDASGGAREVAVGDDIEVELPSNPTTGYSWNALSQPDPAVLTLVDREYDPSSDMPGAGGMEKLTYRAVGPGQTTIELGYFQPWEPDAVDERFTLGVEVAPPDGG